MVSASETSAMPSAPPTRSPRSASLMRGNVKGGSPCGNAHERHAVGQVEGGRRRDRPHHGDEDTGQRGAPPLQADDHSQPGHADRQQHPAGLAVGHAPHEARQLGPEASPSAEKPKSFGNWPTRIVRASPFACTRR